MLCLQKFRPPIRCFILYGCRRQPKPMQLFSECQKAYGANALSLKTLSKGFGRFQRGHFILEDEPIDDRLAQKEPIRSSRQQRSARKEMMSTYFTRVKIIAAFPLVTGQTLTMKWYTETRLGVLLVFKNLFADKQKKRNFDTTFYTVAMRQFIPLKNNKRNSPSL